MNRVVFPHCYRVGGVGPKQTSSVSGIENQSETDDVYIYIYPGLQPTLNLRLFMNDH